MPRETSVFRSGEPVIGRLSKHSRRPARDAEHVRAARSGDDYSYDVKRYWRVEAIEADGRVRVRTRSGKRRVVRAERPALRRARWWERVLYRSKFPSA